jgi:REP element-mobilizing transposase RayT
MPRGPRTEDPHALYHVFSRGNYRTAIFEDPGAVRSFMHALEATIVRAGWEVYAFAIMPNHFHLMIRAPRANLSRGMHLLLSAFSLRFNGYRDEHGHVFQGRYQAKRVPPGMDALRVMDYIHLNHVRKKLLTIEQLASSPLSSIYRLFNLDTRSPFIVGEGLVRFCGLTDNPDGWNLYLTRLHDVYLRDDDGLGFEAQWQVAKYETKLARSAESAGAPLTLNLSDEEIERLDSDYSEKIFLGLLAKGRKTEDDLKAAAGLPEWKLNLALEMIRSTTASFVWLANRLCTGSSTYLANQCRKGQATT